MKSLVWIILDYKMRWGEFSRACCSLLHFPVTDSQLPFHLGKKVSSNSNLLLKAVLWSQSLEIPSNKRLFSFPPWNIFLISLKQGGKLFTEPYSSPVFTTQLFKICKALDWNLVLDSSPLISSKASLWQAWARRRKWFTVDQILWVRNCEVL